MQLAGSPRNLATGARPYCVQVSGMMPSASIAANTCCSEDHQSGEAMCKAAAEAVPSIGMPAMSGDSLECRLHFCTLGHDDPAACASALGAAPCA